MTKVTAFLLTSFGVDETGGNPAGVVLNADNLSDKQKKIIAKQIGYSETAFVEHSTKADYKVRFFTSTDEVDLCGHATIATYSLLFQKRLVSVGDYTQELKAGVLGIAIQEDGLIVMEQALPQFSEIIVQERITKVFRGSLGSTTLKPQIVSTGLRDIMVPVENRKLLYDLQPDFSKIIELNKETNSVGIHAFTFDTVDKKSIANCRNFAPLYGIDEESATGSSTGALACYLYKQRKLSDKEVKNMKFEQGYSMHKPSEIFVSLVINNKQIEKVYIGGKAILFGEKEIDI